MTHSIAAWISNDEVDWIHVIEKLPKHGQKVEAKFFEKGGNIVVADAVFLRGNWVVDFGNHGDVFDVVYWKPIIENKGDNDD